MGFLKYILIKKVGLSIYLLFFFILIASIILRNISPDIYLIPLICMFLIFLLSQYFDFEYRFFIGFAIFMLAVCPFLLILQYEQLAEYFSNYAYGFLVLGILGYFLDTLRENVKKKGYFKIYKVVFLSLLIIFLMSPIVIYRENVGRFFNTFKTDFYVKKDNIDSNSPQIVGDIIITVENPAGGTEISGEVKISGWAIETNSMENSGIDEIVVFIDGKAGEGIYLGKEYRQIKKEVVPKEEFLIRLFEECYSKKPTNKDIVFWIHNIESGNVSIDEVIKEVIKGERSLVKNLSDEKYLEMLYRVLFNREIDHDEYSFWLKELQEEFNRNVLLDKLLDSVEFRNLVRDYYSIDVVYEDDLSEGINLPRQDIGNNYGEQFEMSGFIFNFDSSKFENGDHRIYIYVHSTSSGWAYVSRDIYINN